jgi:hypothetical protein
MPTRSPRPLSATLSSECDALRRRLTQWRGTRPHLRAPIPEPLWAEAVLLARRHGVFAASRALRLGYDGLKRRVSRHPVAAIPAPTFVELPRPSPSGVATWVLEFRGPDGRVLRVQVPPMPVSDLLALGRAVWSGA